MKNGEGNKGGVLLGLGLIKERMGKINEALPVVRQASAGDSRRTQKAIAVSTQKRLYGVIYSFFRFRQHLKI